MVKLISFLSLGYKLNVIILRDEEYLLGIDREVGNVEIIEKSISQDELLSINKQGMNNQYGYSRL